MGKEFASAVMRWSHLLDMDIKPEIVSVCSEHITEEKARWYTEGLKTVHQVTRNWKEVIDSSEVDALYIAVPNHLHEEMYKGAVRAGKHLMGEKPFGIDRAANLAIMKSITRNPDVFVRCACQWHFAPAIQRLCSIIEQGRLGRIIEVEAGFLHSSDLNPEKPINWKRVVKYNGEYGCMGDLGMHILAIPIRAGWYPRNVRAVLSDIVKERPDGKGGRACCETWDNAVLLCETEADTGEVFPMTLKTHRIAPGEKNTWYLNVYGTKTSVKVSTKQINTINILEYSGGDQAWQVIDTGYETAYPTISAPLFEFGGIDSIFQMWAAFLYEFSVGKPKSLFSGCTTPDEAVWSHELFTAALESADKKKTVEVTEPRREGR